MIIGFTGTRAGLTQWQQIELKNLIKLYECTEFIHGDCIGADEEAAEIAYDAGVKIFTIYPQNQSIRQRAWWRNLDKDTKKETGNYISLLDIKIKWMPALSSLERNRLIVDNCQRLIAGPKEFKHTLRSGTWATIRYAWQREKRDKDFRVTIIPPVVRENYNE